MVELIRFTIMFIKLIVISLFVFNCIFIVNSLSTQCPDKCDPSKCPEPVDCFAGIIKVSIWFLKWFQQFNWHHFVLMSSGNPSPPTFYCLASVRKTFSPNFRLPNLFPIWLTLITFNQLPSNLCISFWRLIGNRPRDPLIN